MTFRHRDEATALLDGLRGRDVRGGGSRRRHAARQAQALAHLPHRGAEAVIAAEVDKGRPLPDSRKHPTLEDPHMAVPATVRAARRSVTAESPGTPPSRLERSPRRSGRAHQAVPARLVRRHRGRRAGGTDRHPGPRGDRGRRQGTGEPGRPQREDPAVGRRPDQRRGQPRARLRRRQFRHGRPSDRDGRPRPAGARRADEGVGPAVHRELHRRLRDLRPRRPAGGAQPLSEGLPRHRHGRLLLRHRRGRPHARPERRSSSPSPSASPPPRPPA